MYVLLSVLFPLFSGTAHLIGNIEKWWGGVVLIFTYSSSTFPSIFNRLSDIWPLSLVVNKAAERKLLNSPPSTELSSLGHLDPMFLRKRIVLQGKCDLWHFERHWLVQRIWSIVIMLGNKSKIVNYSLYQTAHGLQDCDPHSNSSGKNVKRKII